MADLTFGSDRTQGVDRDYLGSGAIHVIPVDLNHDGMMDFVALLSQEHETVVAYINKGNYTFKR